MVKNLTAVKCTSIEDELWGACPVMRWPDAPRALELPYVQVVEIYSGGSILFIVGQNLKETFEF